MKTNIRFDRFIIVMIVIVMLLVFSALFVEKTQPQGFLLFNRFTIKPSILGGPSGAISDGGPSGAIGKTEGGPSGAIQK